MLNFRALSTGFMKQMQCNALKYWNSYKTMQWDTLALPRICFEYPIKSLLKSSHSKKILAKFSNPPKILELKISHQKNPSIIQSLKIQSKHPPPPPPLPPPAQHIFKFKTSYFACIVNDSEVCFWAELWDFELCMFTVFFDDFFNKSFVCGLRKPAFLIQ